MEQVYLHTLLECLPMVIDNDTVGGNEKEKFSLKYSGKISLWFFLWKYTFLDRWDFSKDFL